MPRARNKKPKPATASSEETQTPPILASSPEPEQSHVQRLAPRRRETDEQFGIYSSANVRVTKDPETYKGKTVGISIEIKRPLTNETRDGETMYLSTYWQNKLVGYGFNDVSEKGDGSSWLADVRELMEGRPETVRILMDKVNGLGPMIDGKFQRFPGADQGARR